MSTPPSGGPKDITPPKLLYSVPKDQSILFNGKVIKLVFDEYIEVKNLKSGLIITPTVGEYEFSLKKNILTLTFEEDFAPQTTYVLDFGQTIQDVNERNVAENLRIAFSTGDRIDTANISGRVTQLQTGLPEIKASVLLYRKDDTLDIFKHKPMYQTRTDSTGKYHIKNVKPSQYKIYALQEGTKSDLIYNNTQEAIAWDTNTVDLENRSFKIVNLQTVRYDTRPFRRTQARAARQYYEVKYNKGLYRLHLQYADSQFYNKAIWILENDLIRFYRTDAYNLGDSTKIYLFATDSANNQLSDTLTLSFADISKEKNIRKTSFEVKELPSAGALVTPAMNKLSFVLKFNKPVVQYSVDSIDYQVVIGKDTLKKQKLSPQDYSWNQNFTQLSFKKDFGKNVKEFKMQIGKNAFISVESDTLKPKEISYKERDPNDLATISGEIRTDFPYFIVQLTSEKFSVEQELFNTKNFKFEYVTPGDKRIRIIGDLNNNGKWDAGNPAKGILPEPIYVFEEIFKVKPKWDYEDNIIDTSKEPVPVRPAK
ncbi:MAG: Ig-like domain-containing domain [Cytophagales bacterium]|nr:Ig-like domain-containing domain [Bernardetiaceae bacterium]MDW8203773.1 Ig-like domain-containing domain [Cytophagales bacterium]